MANYSPDWPLLKALAVAASAVPSLSLRHPSDTEAWHAPQGYCLPTLVHVLAASITQGYLSTSYTLMEQGWLLAACVADNQP